MFLVSGPDIVVESCVAGVIGSFPTANCRSLEELDDWMDDITTRIDAARVAAERPTAPWAANLVTHSTNERLSDHLSLISKYKPPIVITALGSPRPAIASVRAYGGLIIADVPSVPLARKAVAAGVDGLACICAGAGGHTGHLSPFAFISAVREFFDGLLIVGGGISDGGGIAGAIAAGADLVYMGTRFLSSHESRAPVDYKRMVVECSTEDLIVSSALTGAAASWLKPSLKRQGVDLSGAAKPDFSGRSRWRDIWSAGQGLHKVMSFETVAAIVDDLEGEFGTALRRFECGMSASR